jgi:hypothetical protein
MKPRLLAEMKCPSWIETVAPSELLICGLTAKAACSQRRGQIDAFVDREQPGMIEIEIGNAARAIASSSASGRPAQGSAAVKRAMLSAASTVSRRPPAKNPKCSRALSLAEIDRDRDALVAVVLDGLDLAAANRDRLPEAGRDIDLAGARPAFASMGEDVARQFLQCVEAVAEA